MQDFTLNTEQIELLKSMLHFQSVEIIWDINAFYFNMDKKTFKLECLDEKPVGSSYEYDEIFYCRFEELKNSIEFDDNDSKYWYKIISKDCHIISIQYLNVIELYPDNQVIPYEKSMYGQQGLNKSTLGLIIETDKGFLPAFLLPSNHGFHWQPKFDFYLKSEVDKLIEDNIKYCEIKNCA